MRLRHLDPDVHLRDPAQKQRYVTAVFDTVAPSYDRFTRLFSFGMDARWKRQLAEWVVEAVGPGDLVVDLACGTGDVALAAARATRPSGTSVRVPSGAIRIVGMDPNHLMLASAKRRASGSAALVQADMLAIPCADRSAAAVTVAYGFRNVPDAAAALAEAARVLRPGGWLCSLDFFRPERSWWRRVFLAYLRVAGRAVGGWWHGEPEAYGYVARSLDRWVTATEFGALLRRTGFRVAGEVRHLGGGIVLHRAQRNAAPPAAGTTGHGVPSSPRP
jgi:demethylmenaquinone methyltransferase/2-methoxy-6-polyprenyl-1,4-benzoquinol methylase